MCVCGFLGRLLYESARLLHGHITALEGRWAGEVLVHFRTTAFQAEWAKSLSGEFEACIQRWMAANATRYAVDHDAFEDIGLDVEW